MTAVALGTRAGDRLLLRRHQLGNPQAGQRGFRLIKRHGEVIMSAGPVGAQVLSVSLSSRVCGTPRLAHRAGFSTGSTRVVTARYGNCSKTSKR